MQQSSIIDPLPLQIVLPEIFEAVKAEDTNSTSSSSTATSSSSPSNPSSTSSTRVATGALADVASGPSSSSDNGALVSLLDKYGPVVIGLLAGNMLIMTVLCIIALVACTRGVVRSGARTRSIPSNYAPVSFKDKGINEDPEFSAPVHSYGD